MAKRKTKRVAHSQSKARPRSQSRTKKSLEMHRIAHYAFFAGLLVAIIAGLFQNVLGAQALITTLLILGFLVGLFNLTAKETLPFLVAAIALMLAGMVNFSLVPGIGLYLRAILNNIVVFVIPGAIILGFKTIWKLASD